MIKTTPIMFNWTPNAVEEDNFINIENCVSVEYDLTNCFQTDDGTPD